MFSKKQAVAYCCEPIDTIQGFKEATVSLEKYHIHHRFEDMGLSRKDLMELGLLYHRPACELVFINGREHNQTHSTKDLSDKYKQTLWWKGHVPEFTVEHRQHISDAKTGVKQSPEHILHVKEACAAIRATKEFHSKLHNAQERIWTAEKREEHAEVIKRLWGTNTEYRKAMTKKATASIHRDLEAYKQYKANGGELSWKPFRSLLAQKRKAQ